MLFPTWQKLRLFWQQKFPVFLKIISGGVRLFRYWQKSFNVKILHWNTSLECFNANLLSFFLFQLGHNAQLFEHTCHQLNHCMLKIKKEIIFSCFSQRNPRLHKFTFDLYWLKLSLILVTAAPNTHVHIL